MAVAGDQVPPPYTPLRVQTYATTTGRAATTDRSAIDVDIDTLSDPDTSDTSDTPDTAVQAAKALSVAMLDKEIVVGANGLLQSVRVGTCSSGEAKATCQGGSTGEVR